ncbi:pyridoxal phosphate-dependent transferase [Baffinella frigidus]|nr:pyridoxal phosphate-dependent transferase [Cryptophyta sp. CCMP2293]
MQVEAALRPETVLVSIMHANNETGTINDIASMAKACRARGILFHTDASQSVGKVHVDVKALQEVDMLTIAGHKLYAPAGIGALFVRADARARLGTFMHGAGQEVTNPPTVD